MNESMTMSVRIYPVHKEGAIAAFASVQLAGCFGVRYVKVMRGKSGLFVAMPSRLQRGEYHDVCFPCTKEFKQAFDQAVLAAYEQAMSEKAFGTNPEL